MAKIQGENKKLYDEITTACMAVLRGHGLHPFMVQNTRHAWEVYHKACETGLLDRMAIYKDYTDAHIETALKRIFRN